MGCLLGRLPKHNGQITHKLKALTAALFNNLLFPVFFCFCFNQMAHKLDMHNKAESKRLGAANYM